MAMGLSSPPPLLLFPMGPHVFARRCRLPAKRPLSERPGRFLRFLDSRYTEEPPEPLPAAHLHLQLHPGCEVKKLSAAGCPAILLSSTDADNGCAARQSRPPDLNTLSCGVLDRNTFDSTPLFSGVVLRIFRSLCRSHAHLCFLPGATPTRPSIGLRYHGQVLAWCHGSGSSASKSGRLRRVFSKAFSRRHLVTSAWFPPIKVSGTLHPR